VDTILVIEDDPNIQLVLRHALENAGYNVELTSDGIAGIESFQWSLPSAVILDLRLPGRSGRDVARELKQHSTFTPVIVLSAITDVADKVLLLELGVDDYVSDM
jgi:DNA-binding response OmpR family regulator